jgi:hypothetical protein
MTAGNGDGLDGAGCTTEAGQGVSLGSVNIRPIAANPTQLQELTAAAALIRSAGDDDRRHDILRRVGMALAAAGRDANDPVAEPVIAAAVAARIMPRHARSIVAAGYRAQAAANPHGNHPLIPPEDRGRIAAIVDELPLPDDSPRDARAADAPPVRLWWHGDPDADVSREWRVDQLLPKVGVALISGPWGSYKTFIAIELALAAMVGDAFAGHAVNGRCGALYIAIEGASEIPMRLDGALIARELDWPRLPFARADECPRLLDRNAASALDAIVLAAVQRMRDAHGVELGLVIIDTMAAAAGFGDENSNAEAQRAMNALTRLANKHKCLVAAIDHFGKTAETGTRGASAKEASADSILAVIAEKDLAGNVSQPRLAVRKVRGAPTGAEIPFSMRRIDVNDSETTLAVEWAPVAAKTAAGPRRQQPHSHKAVVLHEALIEALDRHGIEHRPYSDGPTVRAVDQDIIRAEFYRRYPAEGDTDEKRQAARQKAFKRAVEQAQTSHAIGVQVAGDVTLIWPAR